MRIAVDFDGTIVENRFPEIGEERPFALEVLKKFREEEHHVLILWTVRNGAYLEDALRWCEERGLVFDAVNEHYLEDGESFSAEDFSHKVNAHLFIDDRNIGGVPDWTTIYRQVKSGNAFSPILPERENPSARPKNIFIRFGEWIEKIRQEVEARKR